MEKYVEARFGVKVKNIKTLGGSPTKLNFLLSSATDNIRYVYKVKFSKPDGERGKCLFQIIMFSNLVTETYICILLFSHLFGEFKT